MSEEQRRKAERFRNLYIARKAKQAQGSKKQTQVIPQEPSVVSNVPTPSPRTGTPIFNEGFRPRGYARIRYYTIVGLFLFGIFIFMINFLAWLAHILGFRG